MSDPQGMPANQGAPQDVPPTEPKKKKKSWLVGAGLIILVLIGGAVIRSIPNMLENAALDEDLKAGNCLTFSGAADDSKQEVVSCDESDKAFSYEVIKLVEDDTKCTPLPDGTAAPAYVISDASSGEATKAACLVENFVAGKCYKEIEGPMGLEMVDCAAGGYTFKVTDVQESADFECPAADNSGAFSYTEPARTVCFEVP